MINFFIIADIRTITIVPGINDCWNIQDIDYL